jgi:2-methylisocitrate lyase-like PEP mutase family enzyme
VYPIGLTDWSVIETFVHEVAAPVNIWLRPDSPSRKTLAQMGVARISLAGGLFRSAMAGIRQALKDLSEDA